MKTIACAFPKMCSKGWTSKKLRRAMSKRK